MPPDFHQLVSYLWRLSRVIDSMTLDLSSGSQWLSFRVSDTMIPDSYLSFGDLLTHPGVRYEVSNSWHLSRAIMDTIALAFHPWFLPSISTQWSKPPNSVGHLPSDFRARSIQKCVWWDIYFSPQKTKRRSFFLAQTFLVVCWFISQSRRVENGARPLFSPARCFDGSRCLLSKIDGHLFRLTDCKGMMRFSKAHLMIWKL